jgi:surface protein
MTNEQSIPIVEHPNNPHLGKEEAFCFIGCLYHVRKKYKLQGFNSEFINIMFGPYLCTKLTRWDGDIRKAADLWYSDPVAAEKKYGHISKWDTSRVTDMSYLFHILNTGCFPFNEDISGWNVSNVTNMFEMFNGAYVFNQPLDRWDVSKVKNMERMFHGAYVFNQPLDSWDVSNVTNMEGMFSGTRAFNHPINTKIV